MQPFVVQKQQLSIHSEDRDIIKWPNSSVFDIEIPVEYKNVVSLRLADIELPTTYHVFSANNQNISMMVSIGGTTHIVTIEEGTYTPDQMALELQGQLQKLGPFNVQYNPISSKLVFWSPSDFSFDFTSPIQDNQCTNTFYDQYTKWGLGSYLGFQKEVYSSSTTPYVSYGADISTLGNTLVASLTADILGDNTIYMELDLFNSMDEITPYTQYSNAYSPKSCTKGCSVPHKGTHSNVYSIKHCTNSCFHNKHNGNHNSAFAKIPTSIMTNKLYISKETFLSNMFFSDPPLERVQKFKFKFRYHDGRPVYFGNSNYSFTIEVTMLRPDSIKTPIRVNPNHYTLS